MNDKSLRDIISLRFHVSLSLVQKEEIIARRRKMLEQGEGGR